ncbi:MAG: dipeptide/oligopeptide/nickel ABC transporter ATP-binding protein [Geminicoccaceae bacterium]|nr:dipeptide/oligopeptide/nickel ABC transporter ATP-binding protein [Geminicoccaceae bacterium]MCX8100582.1 dipeptide/oligopeptide/nickel ABC transporter ATP-binding protein [Geminicoccaceae bacterium]MDW8369289.1 dipeptide/oligopeptide/nickel ABC transporter ATP-binding protein [Geminicoccaceae bacterium]
MSAPLLEVEDLAYRPPGLSRPIVEGVGFTIGAGERVALVGASGAGKSTLARLLVRLLEPSAGRILWAGRDLSSLRGEALRRVRAELQLVFQDPLAALGPRRRVGALLADPLRALARVPRAERPAAVAGLLRRVGLDPALADRFPHELSGGQRQRVAILRALASRPRLLVLDEPVSALDLSIRARILNLLERVRAEDGTATLLITHDLSVVRAAADRLLVMEAGRIVEEGPVGAVLAAPRAEATRALVAAALGLPAPTAPADRFPTDPLPNDR